MSILLDLAPAHSLSVTIENSKSVYDLKEAIWNETPNSLRSVDVARLTLYKVSLPDGKNLKQLAPQALDQELDVSSEELSQLFLINPPARMVSVIVDVESVCEREQVPVAERC